MMNANTYPWKDRLIALILTAAVFFLSFYGTAENPFWGDDHAGYMNEGIAIAEGRFEQQKQINFRAHPTEIHNEAARESGQLVYAWGYPLLIAAVYSVAGYEPGSAAAMPPYRGISVAAFALMCGAFFLWCRRRFSLAGALVLTAFLGTCRTLYTAIGMCYADILLIGLSVIAFYLTETYTGAAPGTGRTLRGVLLGLVLFLTWEVRTNGFSVAAAAFLCLVVTAVRQKETSVRERIAGVLIPAAAFLVPFIVLHGFVFGPATVEGDSICGFSGVLKNLRYAAYTLKDWMAGCLIFRTAPAAGALGTVMKLAAYAFLAIAALGFFTGMLKHEPHVALFFIGNLIGASMLPYAADQGGRYTYFLIPYTLLCFGYGMRTLIRVVKKRLPEGKPSPRFSRAFTLVPAVLYCGAAVAVTVCSGPLRVAETDCAYSENAVAMYRYIREQTAEDCTILTQKPRVVRLNTGRDCITTANGHTVDEADYLLDIQMSYYQDTLSRELIDSPDNELVCRYGNLTLYRIGGAADGDAQSPVAEKN